MQLGYGKGKHASTEGYRIIRNVKGVDVTTEEGYIICVREHGFRVSKRDERLEQTELLDKDWKDLEMTVQRR